MLAFDKIEFSNFRSYRGNHSFNFPTKPGLYFLTGSNLAEPALEANGAGKSTLLDALAWVLFGRTTRGLKANEVLSWGANTCQVTLWLTVGTEKLKVKRSQKPNGLFLDGKPVDQAELEKHIRLNYDSFKYSVLNAQFGESFLSLSPANKLTLFSDIMNLDFWLKKSDEAIRLSAESENFINSLESQISKIDGRLASVSEDITKFEGFRNDFKNIKQEKMEVLRQNILGLKQEMAKSGDIALRYNEAQFKRLEELRDHYITAIQRSARERAGLVGKLSVLKENESKLSSLGETCPTCLQTIPHGHLNSKTIRHDATTVEYQIIAVDEDLAFYKKELIKLKNKIDIKFEEVERIKAAKTRIKALRGMLDGFKQDLIDENDKENPWEQELESKRQAEHALKDKAASLLRDRHQAEADLEVSNFWIKGFKRVRLFIIEQAFQTLEVEVNNSLTQLGMTDWQITFDIERENKAGGVTKGFVVFIKGPSNKEPVRWESWSGGETQRLQLAADLGLANLIMQQAGLNNSIEMFDEPSVHLSQAGMLDLANMLHDRAVTEGKCIWIIDHTSVTNFGEFEAVINIVKDENGSRIVN